MHDAVGGGAKEKKLNLKRRIGKKNGREVNYIKQVKFGDEVYESISMNGQLKFT